MKTGTPSLNKSIYDLTPEAQVELFVITLTDGTTIPISKYQQVTWLGSVYAEIPCNLTQVEQNTDGSRSRPKFSFANPAGVFTAYILGDLLEGGTLTRERVMASDLQSNADVALRERFRVTKIMDVGNSMCVVELKGALDGHVFKIPARSFIPPEFTHVKLS